MAEQRYDLKEAGTMLGLTPNAVRARAAAGKIRHEKDNRGKWWVFLDPEQAANDRLQFEAQKPQIEASNEGVFEGEIRALQGHVGTLEAALKRFQGEADEWKAEAGRLREKDAAQVDRIHDLELRLERTDGQRELLAVELRHAKAAQDDLVAKVEAAEQHSPAAAPAVAQDRAKGSLWNRIARRLNRSPERS